jgi:hypothetical protein
MILVRVTELTGSILRYIPIGGLFLIIFFIEVISIWNGDLVPLFQCLTPINMKRMITLSILSQLILEQKMD